jgi:ATP-binding cassette subfamily C protein
VGIGIAGALINILYLSGSLYMLEVYDRVLTSRSIPTLIGLSVMVLILYGFQGCLDLLRSRVLVRIGRSLGESLSPRIYAVIGRIALSTRSAGDGLLPLRDIDQVRGFLSSPGPVALLDLPWMPFYILICFLFHFWLGVTALGGALVIVCFTILTELMTRGPQKIVTELSGQRQALAEASRRNAEALRAMGMGPRVAARWCAINEKFLSTYQRTSDVSGGFGALSKVMRMMLQSAVLGVGAYLVILQEATAGIIIAGSILSARALAPVDLAIANWRGFVAFRQSWQRLNACSRASRTTARDGVAEAEQPRDQSLSVVPPGDNRLWCRTCRSGSKGNVLGIVGPSAMAVVPTRALVELWSPCAARCGSTAPHRISGRRRRGFAYGHSPQDVELLASGWRRNIGRFDPGRNQSTSSRRRIRGCA